MLSIIFKIIIACIWVKTTIIGLKIKLWDLCLSKVTDMQRKFSWCKQFVIYKIPQYVMLVADIVFNYHREREGLNKKS